MRINKNRENTSIHEGKMAEKSVCMGGGETSTVNLRSQDSERSIDLDLAEYDVQPMGLDRDRIALHQVESVVITPLPALYDPEGSLVLPVGTIDPIVQFLLRVVA
jgi:hypothetical protein